MSDTSYDEDVVAALVLQHLGECPDLGTGLFRARVTWCALGECPERREADRRIRDLDAAKGGDDE
ncbi:MAG TPA: hypothetical protein VMW79_07985 [Anaerolineae bacterium]|nr:hypothetical protein [Anaerolineae bacterium]